MRNPLKASLAVAVLLTSVAACGVVANVGGIRGSGSVITESRQVAGFSEIVLEGSGEVTVEFTDTESLTISAEDNLMPLLTSKVSNGRLVLGTSEPISPTVTISYRITVASLNSVSIDGSGTITIPPTTVDRFSASIRGSGQIVLSGITVGTFDAEIPGSGQIEVSGNADGVDVSISGSGTFSGEGLKSASASVMVSGSGQAIIFATDRLDGSISGSGAILYLGDPEVISDISGSGEIRRR